jgi:hypothetical protein
MRVLAISALLLAGCCLAGAQDFQRFEVSSGYAYGRIDSASVGNQLYAQGWVGSFAVNLKSWAALEAAAGGQYNKEIASAQGNTYSLNSGLYSFLAGPRLGYRRGKMMPFAHGLFGIRRALDYNQATFTTTSTTSTVYVPYQNVFGAAVGGGVDYGITHRLAVRTQADYFLTEPTGNFLFGAQNNFRATAGLVFSFGGSGRSDGMIARKPRRHEPERRRPKDEPNESVSAPPVSQPATPAPVEPAATMVVAPQPSAPAATTVVAPQPAAPVATTAAPVAAPKPVAPAVAAAPKPAPRVVKQHPPAAPFGTKLVAKPAPPRIVTQRPPTSASTNADQSSEDEPLGDVARRYRQKKQQQQKQQKQEQQQQAPQQLEQQGPSN